MRFDIDTEVYLRTLQMSDAERIFELVDQNRHHLSKWLPWVDGTETVEDTKAFLEHVESSYASQKGLHFGIIYQGQFMGLIGLRFESGHHTANIGYWLSKAATGQGLVTRAVQQICKYGFEHRNLIRIEIRAATENKSSRRIPERLGFTQEGVLRSCEKLGDRFVDHCMYSLLSSDTVDWR